MLVIDDSNYKELIGTGTEVDFGGVSRKLCYRPKPPGLSGKYARKPDFKLIPRNEWASRIKDIEQSGSGLMTRARKMGKRCLDQASTNYCHANSCVNGLVYARMVQGEAYVDLSPGSIGGPATNFQNAGAYINQDLEVAIERGAASVEFVPPNQVSKNGWKAGAEENALLHRAAFYYDLMSKSDGKMFDRVMTLLLQGNALPNGYNWWSHSVCSVQPYYDGVDYGIWTENSWGPSFQDHGFFVMKEGRGTPDDAYCIQLASASVK